jgi:hypothetical protein
MAVELIQRRVLYAEVFDRRMQNMVSGEIATRDLQGQAN